MDRPLIIESDNNKNKTSNITYVRLTDDIRNFVDNVALDLACTRSDAIRKIIEAVKNQGVEIKTHGR